TRRRCSCWQRPSATSRRPADPALPRAEQREERRPGSLPGRLSVVGAATGAASEVRVVVALAGGDREEAPRVAAEVPLPEAPLVDEAEPLAEERLVALHDQHVERERIERAEAGVGADGVHLRERVGRAAARLEERLGDDERVLLPRQERDRRI